MRFSDSSGKTGLVEDIDFLCGTDSTSYPVADKTRNGNRWLYRAVARAIRANKSWQFDDSNLTDLPIATTTMVAAQQDYSLPTDILKLERVEVKDSAGNWSVVKGIDEVDLPNTALSEFQETNGLPRFYDIIGSSIFLYPAPAAADTTLTAGLKLYYSREIDAFVAADTAQEPGVAEPFHRIVSLGAAYDWFLVPGHGDQATRSSIRAEIEQLMRELDGFYAERDKKRKTRITPAHRQGEYA